MGRYNWVEDALVVRLYLDGSDCGMHAPIEGDVNVTLSTPRATATPGEQPVGSSIVRSDDVDVAVARIGAALSSESWLLESGVLRLDAVDETHVAGGVVASGGAGSPSLNGQFDVPLCPSP